MHDSTERTRCSVHYTPGSTACLRLNSDTSGPAYSYGLNISYLLRNTLLVLSLPAFLFGSLPNYALRTMLPFRPLVL